MSTTPSLAEIVPTLITPPWAKGAKKRAPRVIPGVKVEARAERVRSGGSLTYSSGYKKWEPFEGERLEKHIAELEAARAAGTPIHSTSAICWLPRDQALAWWNREDVSFNLSDWGIRTIIAVYDLDGLDSALRRMNAGEKDLNSGRNFGPDATWIDGFKQVDSTRIAPLMVKAWAHEKKGSSERDWAEDWLLRVPETASVALIPRAVGELGPERDDAENALRLIDFRGHGEIVRRVAARYGEEIAAEIEEVLAAFQAPKKAPKLPEYLGASKLPRVKLAGQSGELGDAETENLLLLLTAWPPDVVEECEPLEEALQDPEEDAEDGGEEDAEEEEYDDPLSLGEVRKVHLQHIHPGVLEARRACDPDSLDALALAIFEAWIGAGAPPKDKWVFFAAGALGGDRVVRAIAPLIRSWPREKQHARAVLGLDVLLHIGSDLAVGVLASIAQRTELKALAHDAAYRVRRLAKSRGSSRADLADRLVPDLGLDESSTMLLDFGPRRFRAVLGDNVELRIHDDAGAIVPGLPKPSKSDDAAKAKAAHAAWAALSDSLREVGPVQIRRLEAALVEGRRWSAEAFGDRIVNHPLIGPLVRRLVFGVYEGDKLITTFRIAEDRSLAGSDDARFTLAEGARVGIVHPISFDENTRMAWAGRFGDYKIAQPFPQIGREIFAIEPGERGATELTRASGKRVPSASLFSLERRGWGRRTSDKRISEYVRAIGPKLDALLTVSPGLDVRKPAQSGEQTLGAVVLRRLDGPFVTDQRAPLGELDGVTFSEIVRDLLSLVAAS